MWGPSQGPEPDTQTGLRRPAPVGIAEGEQPACAAAAGPPRARMGAQGGGGGGGHQAQGPSSGWRCPGSPSVSRPGARAQGSGVTLSVPVLRGGRGGSGLLAAGPQGAPADTPSPVRCRGEAVRAAKLSGEGDGPTLGVSATALRVAGCRALGQWPGSVAWLHHPCGLEPAPWNSD